MAVASLDETTAAKVLRQVEFYFSDSNLPRDKFLKQKVEESEDGLVSLGLICSFARMRTHLGLGEVKEEAVPEDKVLAVAETLRKSNVLKVSEDGKMIGRSTELAKPEEVKEQLDSRTVAVSPLPYDVNLEDVEAFFNQHGKVNSVRLPRLIGDKRQFCGTALIEFSEEEDANKALSTSMVFAGAELEVKTKKDFDDERLQKWEEFEKTRPSKDASNGSYPKGLIVAFKLKSIPSEGSTEENGQEVNKGAEACKVDEASGSEGNIVEDDEMNTSESVPENEGMSAEDIEKGNGRKVDEDHTETDKKADGDAQEGDAKVTEGSPVENVKKNTVSTDNENVIFREDLMKIFQKFGTVKFIDFRMGEESGYIRFEDSDAAVKARAEAVLTDEGGFIVKKHIATLEPLTGDAEKEYWSLLRGNQDKYRENKGNNKRGRGKGNRGGRQFDGKRNRQGDSHNGRANKAQKV
ncbi:uncharacterized protein A4U43_C04F14980 [Asparagus officinalis]|uniref:La protein 1 n=1 Tax=Asparagus officinalis TaxID=4686 RepID=A0A5P1F1G7_ASPOF|nr:la protein 1-like [Asparagus officinalis]ONK72032.1 uncharacterized protein A4U43_C04F14980 [Asparagus officinalis]